MSRVATQTLRHEEIELQSPGPTPSTPRTFDVGNPKTPTDSTTRLHVSSDSQGSPTAANGVSEGDIAEPQEGAVEVAPEGGYGWVVVASCSVAM